MIAFAVRRYGRLLAAAAALGFGAGAAHAAQEATPPPVSAHFLERSVVVDGATRRYRVFVPRDDARPRPVILFLHGSGERGTDNARQTHVGLGPAIVARADTFPAIAVFPQAGEGGRWSGVDADVAMAALDAATAEFGGDPARTYLTGLSRGGYGVFELALAFPHRFAALVPVCGGLRAPPARADLYVEALAHEADPYGAAATKLKHVPTWLFHGAKDDLVPPEFSRQIAGALLGAGANVRYTEFPDANHNAWDGAYAHAPMWEWLFVQKRKGGI